MEVIMTVKRFFKSEKGSVQEVQKIGILGACNAVGTTHLSMMTANYCANCKGLKTALVECNNHKDYIRICNETKNIGKDIYHFSYQHIDFISGITPKKLADLAYQGYHAIILDCSMEHDFYFAEFLRCDIRIVVCSTELYKIGNSRRLLNDVKKIPVQAAAFCADKKAKAGLEKEFKRVIMDIPMECNSLYIGSTTCNWFDRLLDNN